MKPSRCHLGACTNKGAESSRGDLRDKEKPATEPPTDRFSDFPQANKQEDVRPTVCNKRAEQFWAEPLAGFSLHSGGVPDMFRCLLALRDVEQLRVQRGSC